MPAADDDERGQMSANACRVVMKDLWLARLARPELVKPIGDLASQVQNWTVNSDRALHRLMCYMHSTTEHVLCGHVRDPIEKLSLRL